MAGGGKVILAGATEEDEAEVLDVTEEFELLLSRYPEALSASAFRIRFILKATKPMNRLRTLRCADASTIIRLFPYELLVSGLSKESDYLTCKLICLSPIDRRIFLPSCSSIHIFPGPRDW